MSCSCRTWMFWTSDSDSSWKTMYIAGWKRHGRWTQNVSKMWHVFDIFLKFIGSSGMCLGSLRRSLGTIFVKTFNVCWMVQKVSISIGIFPCSVKKQLYRAKLTFSKVITLHNKELYGVMRTSSRYAGKFMNVSFDSLIMPKSLWLIHWLLHCLIDSLIASLIHGNGGKKI